LITTAFGLIVAIPAVWLYNYFTTKIDFLSVEMTYTSKELIDYLIKSVGSEFGRSIFTKEFQTQKGSQSSGPIRIFTGSVAKATDTSCRRSSERRGSNSPRAATHPCPHVPRPEF